MPYSTDVSNLIAHQLSRFVTLNPHQLAGQVENLGFWLSEVRHALAVIDGYGVRFVRMESAQTHATPTHVSKQYRPETPSGGPFSSSKPHRIPDNELQKARKELIKSVQRFIERCWNEGLISDQQYAEICKEFVG